VGCECNHHCSIPAPHCLSHSSPIKLPRVIYWGNIILLGSLSNHDDDNKNPTNLHIWQWKIVFLHALHVHISFFSQLVDVRVLSTTWNDQFCSCVDDVSRWWQMFLFVFLCPKHWFHFNSRIVRTQQNDLEQLRNYCRNARLRFQMTFSLPSSSCLPKLPNGIQPNFTRITSHGATLIDDILTNKW